MMIIINLIVAALLFLDIRMFQAPETTISIDIIEINSEEAILQTTIDVNNRNTFGVITKNLEVVTTTPDGVGVSKVMIEGGEIPPNENRTFTATATIAFDGHSPKLLTTRLTGNIGVNIGFIQKTIPIAINIVSSVEDVIKELAPPVVHLEADFGEITQESINVTGVIDVYNPNTFDIFIEDITAFITTETGKKVGNLNVTSGVITAKSSKELDSNGTILIDALNAKILFVNISGAAGAKVAGINKSLQFSVEAQIKVPDLGMFLSDLSTDAVISGDYRLSINGLIDTTIFEVYNPNKISLLAENITVGMYRIDNDEEQLIAECSLGGGIIKAENVTTFRGELTIPYHKLLPIRAGRLIPDWLKIIVRANLSIPGINYSIRVGVIGYQDFRLLR